MYDLALSGLAMSVGVVWLIRNSIGAPAFFGADQSIACPRCGHSIQVSGRMCPHCGDDC